MLPALGARGAPPTRGAPGTLPGMGERRIGRRLLVVAGTAAALVVSLAGCSSQSDVPNGGVPLEATATATFARAEPVADGTTVAAGDWGIVRAADPSDGDRIVALRVTAVTEGEPGDFSGVRSLSGGSMSDDAVGWWVDYDWVLVDGAGSWYPNHWMRAETSDADRDDLSTLSVPDDLQHCRHPERESFEDDSTGLVQHVCLTASATGGVRPTALTFSGTPGSTQDVTWSLPQRRQRD